MNDPSPQPRTPSEEIAGLVERVTFFNEESGFAVLRVKVSAFVPGCSSSGAFSCGHSCIAQSRVEIS
jgi:hypothetical protein